MSFKNLFILLKKARSVTPLILLLFMGFDARSSHMAGAELEYQYLGNDHYKVIYTLYSDCSGSQPSASMNLTVRSSNCGINDFYTLSAISGSETEISPNCTSSPSTCNGGTSSGYKQIKYAAVIPLTEKCNDIIFSVTDCCRNSAITSIIHPDTQPLYVEAHLNNISGPNNSPVFDSKPVMILSTNQLNQISESAIDTDGDSLVYSLIAPKTSEITDVIFANGFTAEQFVSSTQPIVFNTENGTISVSPEGIETSILAIKVTEFREGIEIGSTMRDIQVISINSTNTLPTIQQLDALNSLVYKLCVGDNLVINLSSVDPDAGQQALIDVTSNIQGLIISKSTDLLQKVQIKWTALPSNGQGEWIKVTVTDNGCPMNGVKTYMLQIKVSEMAVLTTVTNSDCIGKNNGTIYLTVQGSEPSVEYMWSHTNSNQSFVTGLAAGSYTVSINNFNGCIENKTFQVNNNETLKADISTTHSSCRTANGTAEISISGGTLPYSYRWNDNSTIQNRTDLKKGNYSIVVTDQIGCTLSKILTIESEECESKISMFKLYPNPALNAITIQNDFLTDEIHSLVIYDASGRIVYEQQQVIVDQLLTNIDLSSFSTGVYFVKIMSNGDPITLPFLKQ